MPQDASKSKTQTAKKSEEWMSFSELVTVAPFGRNEMDKLVKVGVFKPLINPLVKRKGNIAGTKRMFRRSSVEEVFRKLENGEDVLSGAQQQVPS